MKNEPTDITELRKRVAKANELSKFNRQIGFDNRGNHALGAFLTGVLQEYDRVVAELARWKTGDWCDICNRPQWVAIDGSHECANIEELQMYISNLEHANATIQNFHSAVNDIATALGWRPGQPYDIQAMINKIKELQK